jgi:hypothetical protein
MKNIFPSFNFDQLLSCAGIASVFTSILIQHKIIGILIAFGLPVFKLILKIYEFKRKANIVGKLQSNKIELFKMNDVEVNITANHAKKVNHHIEIRKPGGV